VIAKVDEGIARGELHPKTAEMVEAVAFGESQADAAIELGLSKGSGRKVMFRVRNYVALAFAAALVFWWVRRNDDIARHDQPVPGATDAGAAPNVPPPPPSARPPEVLVDTKAEEYAKAVERAKAAAKQKKWKECVEALHDAPVLPTPREADVVKLQQACDEGYLRSLSSKTPPQ
jgi:hypothetical protein